MVRWLPWKNISDAGVTDRPQTFNMRASEWWAVEFKVITKVLSTKVLAITKIATFCLFVTAISKQNLDSTPVDNKCGAWAWIHTLYLPECQGTPCSKQAPYLKFYHGFIIFQSPIKFVLYSIALLNVREIYQ